MNKQCKRHRFVAVFILSAVFTSSVYAAWQAGLKSGYIADDWDTTGFPTVTEQQLGPHAGATNAKPPWADNRTWVYTGQIYLDGSTYHFAEAIDNNTSLKIDGTSYLYSTDHTTAAKSGPVTLAAGWHDVEIRFGNGTGGAGPNYNLTGWTTTKGFGYNIGGADSYDGADYDFPWDDGNMTFFRFDDGTSGIYNKSATNVTSASATLNGELLSTNAANLVSVFWGPTDGGEIATAWSNRIDFAYPAIQGVFSTNVTIAAADSLTFYRYYTSNDVDIIWADETEVVLSGEITAQVIDSSATEYNGDTGIIRFSRPSTATNGSLTVYFSLDGTASPGMDFVNIGNSVVIPEGETSVDVTITPLEDLDWNEGDETVSLTLAAGSYIIGTASSLEVTIQDSGSPDLYAESVPVIFTGHRLSETLTDFPVLVQVGTNVNGFSYSDLLSGDSNDLRFTDGITTNYLHYEVESWNTNGISQVWVKVPALVYESVIWMHWGRSGVVSPAYTTNGLTWDNDYALVYHLAEDSGTVKDSSPYGNDASIYGDVQQGTDGIAGPAARWPDGINDWIERPTADSLHGMDAMTLQLWFYDEKNDGQARGLISKRFGNSTGNDQKDYYFYKHTNSKLNLRTKDGAGGEFANSATGADQWYFVAGTYDSSLETSHMRAYINGEYKSSVSNDSGPVPTYESDLHIGILNADYGNSWMGTLDEVRISRTVRSTQWLRAEYMNIASNKVFQAWPEPQPTLVVDGDRFQYGTPVPAYGTTNVTGGGVVTCTAPQTVMETSTKRYFCYGYQIYSNLVDLVVTGSGNSCTYTNSNGADRLVWLWKTQYYVAFTNDGPGTVSTYGGWYDDGSVATCTASGTGGGQFVEWQGDVDNIPGQQVYEAISVDVYEPVSLTAKFIPAFSPSGWKRQMEIVFDGYDRTETLTNFPMMVQFTDGLANYFHYSDMGSPLDAGDLRFTAADGTTELYYDIEKWDPDGTSIVWVRIPELSVGNNLIYAHWKNSTETNAPLYVTNGKTWDNGFVAVYHLAENSEPIKDSSPYGNTLERYGDVQLGTNGMIGAGARWPSISGNDWIYRHPTDSLHGMGQLTLQTWFYDTDNGSLPRGLISKRTDSGTEKSYYFFKFSNQLLYFYVGGTGGSFPNTATSANQWYFASATYDKYLASDRLKMYVDGDFKSALPGPTGDVPVYSSLLRIGIMNADYTYSGGTPCCWEGNLDEVRLSAAARSADWIWAEYNNVKNHDTFQSYHIAHEGTLILVQ